MALINRGNIVSALRPGIHAWFGLSYNRYEDEYKEIFDIETSDMNFERDANVYSFGMGLVKPEGTAVQYDTMAEGWTYDYVHIPYALGFSITHEAMMDNLYMKLAKQNTMELGKSMKETKETVCANILNRAFNNSYVYGDGVELCSTANLLSAGGTFANKLAVDADLSETALEQALIDIAGFVNDRGLKAKVKARKIIVPKEAEFEIQRLLKTQLRVGTADNDINVISQGMYFPDGYTVNHYLTDPDAWFIKTDCMNGLKHFVREGVTISTDEEFNTDNILVKAYERYSVGCSDKRGIYGSQGA